MNALLVFQAIMMVVSVAMMVAGSKTGKATKDTAR